jgi:hypothetical protein
VCAAILFYLCKYLFFYDGDIFVVNPHDTLKQDFTRGAVVKLTFLADNFFWRTNVAGYHITNVLLHLCNTLLATIVFQMLLKFTVLDEVRARNAGYIFFFLFLLSPVHTEPLCYLLGREGIVATVFCTLSLLFFLKANFEHMGLLVISQCFFLLALFSYETSWAFPVILLLVANYLKQYKPLTRRIFFIYVMPFFAVFCLWFLVNIFFLNQLKTTPYGNDAFLSFNPLRLAKNMVILFFRNVVPPFESTAIFVTLSVITAGLCIYVFTILKRKNTPLFFFALLIVICSVLAYLPALTFDINSNALESERYIYFSSVFAIMFLALAISLLQNQQTRKVVVIIVCGIYAYFFFATINNYIQGSKLSQSYLEHLAREQGDAKKIYLINEPSEYNGALLFSTNGNMQDSSKKNFYTIDDFMQSLYAKTNSEYITLSKKEILSGYAIKNVVRMSADSLPLIFQGFYISRTKNVLINSSTGDSTYFENGNSIIAGLKLPSLYIFK